MAKSFKIRLLKNNLGQSAVEYILLLAVISGLSFTFFHNKRFKDFLAGTDGFFSVLKKGISYSFRYGVELKKGVSFEDKMQFDYTSNAHDTYLNPANGTSHFFTGTEKYPKN